MISLSGVLRKSGHEIFQNITEVVGVSLLAAVILLPGIFLLPPLFGAIYLILTGIPGLMGAFYSIYQRINRKPFKYSIFFKAFKKFYLRGVILGVVLAVLTFIPVSSWWYYSAAKTSFSFIIAVFQSYLYIMLLISFIYVLPVVVLQDRGISYGFKTSLRLFLENPTYTIGSFIQIAAVSSLLIITVVSIPILFAGMFSIFTANLYENILSKYEVTEG